MKRFKLCARIATSCFNLLTNQKGKIMLNEQDIAVAEYLKSIPVSFKATLIQELHVKDNDWQCDKWVINLGNNETFDYYTGVGHRTSKLVPKGSRNKPNTSRPEYIKARKSLPPQSRMTIYEHNKLKANEHLTVPTSASVLYSLLMDAECGNETHGDFCDNFGYDRDSIKGRRIYLACQETGEQVRKIFTQEQIEKLTNLLEDY